MADFYKVVAPTLKAEGGKSKALTDSAHVDPVPDGSGYHTNKGVTWTAFKALAPKIGYVATPALFYEMPQSLWLKIAKVGYWDTVNCDKVESNAVAYALFTHSWGAGPGTAARFMQSFLNKNGNKLVVDGAFGNASVTALNATVKKNEPSFFTAYINATKKWLTSLPNQEANYAGWTTRMNQMLKDGLDMIKANPVTTASSGGIFFLALGAFIFRKQIKKLFTKSNAN